MAIDAHIRELGAAPLMAGFELLDVDVADDITIRAAAAGRGSPVLCSMDTLILMWSGARSRRD